MERETGCAVLKFLLKCPGVDEQAKAYNTCIAPQVAYRNCRGAGHDTERAGVGPIGCKLSLSLRPQADL